MSYNQAMEERRAPWRGFSEEKALEDLVLVTGFSGAGKSTAMKVFEDAGYFCIDNLPPAMLRNLAELFTLEGSHVRHAAIVCDTRAGEYFSDLAHVIDDLKASGVPHRVLFLAADPPTLQRRFKETRRRHPLSQSGSVQEGIEKERQCLTPVRERADALIDTSDLGATALRRKVANDLLSRNSQLPLAVSFVSFGHKNGTLSEADISFDVRFLPNPHYVDDLRPLTGRDAQVVEYIAKDGTLDQWYGLLLPMLDFLLPRYAQEGKTHLVVGIGCTGGHHRSVAIAEYLARHYQEDSRFKVDVSHRDIHRPH